MAVRIQLASNFQVVELTYDSWSEVDEVEIVQATDLVNELGQNVVNEIKSKNASKEAEVQKKNQMRN